ncbi:MAG: tetratricopeptide repeat protein [Flavobacteriales bacterium]|nr:tetratricopeptide repeat protein [Flavobacteriales bacterium]
MRAGILLGLAALVTASGHAQDRIDRFYALVNGGDIAAADSLVSAWAVDAPQDAELFVARFNLHLKYAMTPVLRLDTEPLHGEQLVLTDPETGAEVGYLGEDMAMAEAEFDQALKAIAEGIALHPDRLDMHLGRIFILGKEARYAEQADAIVQVLEQDQRNQHQWLWSKNVPHPDGLDLLQSSIQGHMYTIFNDPYADLEPIATVSRKFIACYPDHVYGYTNLGGYHASKEEYAEAMRNFNKAHSLDPKDALVLLNIAHCQEQQGNPKAAAATYDKVMKLDDADAREYAAERKAALKGKR